VRHQHQHLASLVVESYVLQVFRPFCKNSLSLALVDDNPNDDDVTARAERARSRAWMREQGNTAETTDALKELGRQNNPSKFTDDMINNYHFLLTHPNGFTGSPDEQFIEPLPKGDAKLILGKWTRPMRLNTSTASKYLAYVTTFLTKYEQGVEVRSFLLGPIFEEFLINI
jgi:hypothetical protein